MLLYSCIFSAFGVRTGSAPEAAEGEAFAHTCCLCVDIFCD